MTELYLVAEIGGRSVAIASEQVESVVDLGPVVPVPLSAPQVRGLAALRSRVVTVIDSRLALGLPEAPTQSRRAIITVVDGHHYAIAVDTLDDVAPFTAQPVTTGVALGGGWQAVAAGMIERADEPVLVVDLRAFVPGSAPAPALAA